MKFILTPELGRLSKWLRILGFDVAYISRDDITALIIQALRDNRIILTRNTRLLNKLRVGRAIGIKSDSVSLQLKQVLGDLNIRVDQQNMFSRCTICNTELSRVDKEKIQGKVPEYVFNTQEEFFSCLACRRIYWAGTHWGNVRRCLEEIRSGVSG